MAIITVFVLPPSESCSRRVSFESRYGMCCDFPSTSADMTFPSALSERLIFVASFSRSPLACVLLCRSEPAKSTRFSFPTVMCGSAPGGSPGRTRDVSTVTVKMECDRLESAFMSVAPTLLFFFPTWRILCISSADLTTNVVRPFTYTPRSGVSLSSHVFVWSFASRSRTFSL